MIKLIFSLSNDRAEQVGVWLMFSGPTNTVDLVIVISLHAVSSRSRLRSILLTITKLENDRLIIFPAMMFFGWLDMLIIMVKLNAYFVGK